MLAAVVVPEEVLPADEGSRWRRVLEMAEKQGNKDKAAFDKFVRQYKTGSVAPEAEFDTEKISANQTFGFINVLLSLLYHQNPNISIEPRLESGQSLDRLKFLVEQQVIATEWEGREIFAQTLQKVLEYSYEEGLSEKHNNAALFENLARGLGWTKSSFDPMRGLDRCDALRRDEVFVDPHARCDVSQAQYIVQTCVMPIDAARELFAAKEFTGKIEANYTLSQGAGLEAQKAKQNDPAAGEKDCFKFYEVWSKQGSGRFVDYWDGVTKQHLMRRDWPFMLDYDEFPFEALCFNQQYTQVSDAFSDVQVVAGLRKLYEEMVEYFQRHIRRTLAKKVLYDSSLLNEEQARQLMDPSDMRFVGVKADGKSIDGSVKVVDFNSGVDTSSMLARDVKQIADEIVGMDEIQRGGMGAQKEITATHAEIIDEYGRLRMGRRQKMLDEWLTRQVRHRAQIVRQLVTAEKVRKIAGEKAAIIWEILAYDPEDLIAEYSIGIVAGSSGERARRMKIDRMLRMSAQMQTENEKLGWQKYNTERLMLDMFREDGERHPEKYQNPEQPEKPEEDTAQPFLINGSSVDGLLKLALPPLQNVPPLISFEEARNIVAKALGVPAGAAPAENAVPAPVPQDSQLAVVE
jgi:hypothetical protein